MSLTRRISFVLSLAGMALIISAISMKTVNAAPAQAARWTIPQGGAEEKNPLPINAATLAGGKKLFAAKCEHCHGAAGKGDGPDADPQHAADMDLTVLTRAARNPDGTVFYKIWNGRLNPKMPAFSSEMTKEQVWAIVAYAQSLRK